MWLLVYYLSMKRALFWKNLGNGKISCELCPHRCVLSDGQVGICRVRGVKGDQFEALSYGHVSSVAIDPIEKKPLYHFLPGSKIFSVGGWGCNFSCKFCQNWEISQQFSEDSRTVTAEALVQQAVDSGTGAIAYTYNEPFVNYEFVYDCARLARDNGLKNVLVTNGYIMPAPASQLLPYIDAVNIDIKSFDKDFYVEHCCGDLVPVLNFAKQVKASGCHLEITNLIIPECNDGDDVISALAEWIADNLGRDTVLHLSAYFPRYKMNIKQTSYELLEHAKELVIKRLDNVYLGNV